MDFWSRLESTFAPKSEQDHGFGKREGTGSKSAQIKAVVRTAIFSGPRTQAREAARHQMINPPVRP